jgi:hypothetical protein
MVGASERGGGQAELADEQCLCGRVHPFVRTGCVRVDALVRPCGRALCARMRSFVRTDGLRPHGRFGASARIGPIYPCGNF